jgi:hypothetical protein
MSEFDFKLAIFPNPMRDDGVFVAEDKPIEPYDRGQIPGQPPRRPTIPNTKYSLGMQLERRFAEEIVRRWNVKQEGQASPENHQA